MSTKKLQILGSIGAGKTTENGGEIFNDYDNNKALSEYSSASGYKTSAGGKAFTIKEVIEKSTEKLITISIPADVLNEYDLTKLRLRVQFTHDVNEGTQFCILGTENTKSFQFVNQEFYDFGQTTQYRYDYGPNLVDTDFDGNYIEGGFNAGKYFTALINNTDNSPGGIMSSPVDITSMLNDDGSFDATFRVINGGHQDLEIILALMDGIGNSGALYNHRSSAKIHTVNGNSFEIEDTTGIEVDDIWSLYSTQLGTNLDFYGKVTDVGSTGIIVDKIPDGLNPIDSSTTNYIWFPYKPYLNGDVSIGAGAYAGGYETVAIPFGAYSEGYNTLAAGKYSHAQNNSTKAGWAAHAQNLETEALGIASNAQGTRTKATGRQSDANGFETVASGDNATSNGYRTTASGSNSDAGGSGTVASGNISFTRGLNTKATMDRAFAIGNGTEASAKDTFATGWLTKATAWTQTAVGKANAEDPYALFVVGNGSSDADRKNAFVVKTDGSARLAKGGTANDSVVNYQQLREYVSANSINEAEMINYVAENGKSPWDTQSEMLFSTGDVKITNHEESETESNGKITIGERYGENGGKFSSITNESICVKDVVNDLSCEMTPSNFRLDSRFQESYVPTISLSHAYTMTGADSGTTTNLTISTNGLTYNDKTISWERIIAAVEKIENSN